MGQPVSDCTSGHDHLRDGERLLKRWYQRRVIEDRQVDLWVGPYPEIKGAAARKLAEANAELIATGGDPREEKRKKKTIPTLAEAAENIWRSGGVNKSKRYKQKSGAFSRITHLLSWIGRWTR